MKDNYEKNFNDLVVCCSTCFNDNCKHNRLHNECLDVTCTRNKLLYWSEETGYLPKLNNNYPYINWMGKPEFIRKAEMWFP
jgi:hypothetical protein